MCPQGAGQEGVPAAVTTAVALVAMGTSRAEQTESGQQGQTNCVLHFLMVGEIIQSNIHICSSSCGKICENNMLVTFWYFTLSHMMCFSTLNHICERNTLVA